MPDNEEEESDKSEYIEASEEASEEASDEASDETSDEETIIQNEDIAHLNEIEPIIQEKKNENLNKLFDSFLKKINKKKEKQEKKRKVKNYDTFKKIIYKILSKFTIHTS